MHQNQSKLILGSQSPRRRALLQEAGYHFDIISFSIDESFPIELPIRTVAEYLANKKNEAYRKLSNFDNEVLITSDTTVLINERILNKPKNEKESIAMLEALSGQTHEVATGVSISNQSKTTSFTDITQVTFNKLDANVIQYYIDNYKPYDKAGSYGIQEWIGLTHISSISGSYFTVMGLPTHIIYEKLKEEFGIFPI